jgi:hydrogenase maturation protein HypF
MVDATRESAVAELRRRKHRAEKPFAVMFRHLEVLEKYADVPLAAAQLLVSPAAPIVLVRRYRDAALAPSVAPGNPWIGALLPSTPLHVLLMESTRHPLVATSANLAEEPLCADVSEAHAKLVGIADFFLDHDRPIAHPVDDSVVRFAHEGPVMLRRARGYAPGALQLPAALAGHWLCTGAQMKGALAVAAGHGVVLSPHIGDLDGVATLAAYRRTAEVLRALQGGEFTAVACDKHPDYASTRLARETGLPLVAVQHHLAHVLACLLENRRKADGVLGIAWDGTGLGEDGTVWGANLSCWKTTRPGGLPACARSGSRGAMPRCASPGALRSVCCTRWATNASANSPQNLTCVRRTPC